MSAGSDLEKPVESPVEKPVATNVTIEDPDEELDPAEKARIVSRFMNSSDPNACCSRTQMR